MTRFALDRWTVDAFALTALPLNTILRTLVATRVPYKRIQMFNMFSSIACQRIALPVIEFVSIRKKSDRTALTMEKSVTVSRHRTNAIFFLPFHRFIYRNLIHGYRKPLQKYYSSRIKQNCICQANVGTSCIRITVEESIVILNVTD